MTMTKPVVSPFYSWKISLALQSARVCALREEDEDRRFDLLTAIAGAQVHAGDQEGAYREVTSSRESARTDVDFLAKMAEAQVSLGDFSGALSRIRQGLLLDERAFSCFLTLCRIAGVLGKIADDITANEALDLAERTFAEHLLKEKTQDVRPTHCTDLTWLTYLAEAQAVMGRREKTDHTLQSALDLVSSEGYDLLRRQEVIDSGYLSIIYAQVRMGDIPGALKTLEKVSDRELVGSSMSHIACVLAEGGDLSGALSFVAQIDEAKPRTQALLGIAEIQARQGDSVGAKHTLTPLRPATNVTGRCEHAEVLLRIALVEVQRGDRDSAKCTLAESMHIVDDANRAFGEYRNSMRLLAESMLRSAWWRRLGGYLSA